MSRRWFWRLSLLMLLLALMFGTLLMHVLQTVSVVAVQSSIHDSTPVLTGVRLTVIALIACLWPRLIHCAHQSGRISQQRNTALQSLRWRAVAWLLIIELFLGQNLIGHLVTAMDGAGA